MKVVGAYTTGETVASARFRIRQYKNVLLSNDILIKEYYTKYTSYPPEGLSRRINWGIGNIFERTKQIDQSKKYDVNIIQKLFLSKYVTLERLVKNKIIFDIDDAIWINGSKNISKVIGKISSKIICGNEFLAEHFSEFSNNVVILPTAVNTDRYLPSYYDFHKDYINIGWSGNSSGLKYLYDIEKELKKVISPKVHLLIICNEKPNFKELNYDYIDYIKWSKDSEVQALQKIDIGIMPLRNDEFERGKCSYKMLLYMSCAKPVVVSNIGMNSKLLKESEVGIGINRIGQWSDALNTLINNENLRMDVGKRGRKLVVEKYSTNIIGRRLAEIIKNVYQE